MLLAIAASEDLEISKFDVKTAFVNGDLEQELYMEFPPGLKEQRERGLVCKLQRSLYGLKEAPRCWNSKFVNFLLYTTQSLWPKRSSSMLELKVC
ncbi:Reverse transcriptase (RNA-dependent DNA polymerase) [Popillia japonica]|uniref:Reverse transcriptase (RNA-dependent DNA polymerase) n=1 Tax=Popillia japonica TaxID=7064 RepID=A0AAW1K271_POPJA